ncbi:MAG: hypothetical protein ACK56F_24120, partial [bacterium]
GGEGDGDVGGGLTCQHHRESGGFAPFGGLGVGRRDGDSRIRDDKLPDVLIGKAPGHGSVAVPVETVAGRVVEAVACPPIHGQAVDAPRQSGSRQAQTQSSHTGPGRRIERIRRTQVVDHIIAISEVVIHPSPQFVVGRGIGIDGIQFLAEQHLDLG